jgi:hypothetical protein
MNDKSTPSSLSAVCAAGSSLAAAHCGLHLIPTVCCSLAIGGATMTPHLCHLVQQQWIAHTQSKLRCVELCVKWKAAWNNGVHR